MIVVRNITKVTLIVLSVALLSSCAKTTNKVHSRKYPINFVQAKKIAREIYKLHPKTFYCSCEFNNDAVIDFKKCGFKPKNNSKRNYKLEWEHVVTAKELGGHYPCWNSKICTTKKGKRYKGRKCCEKINSKFNLAISDGHNIVPSIGSVNNTRGAKNFSNVEIENYEYGLCKIGFNIKTAIPDKKIRGVIARKYLYMIDTYNIEIDNEYKNLMINWNKAYPPSETEVKIHDEIAKTQGSSNPYVKLYYKFK